MDGEAPLVSRGGWRALLTYLVASYQLPENPDNRVLGQPRPFRLALLVWVVPDQAVSTYNLSTSSGSLRPKYNFSKSEPEVIILQALSSLLRMDPRVAPWPFRI